MNKIFVYILIIVLSFTALIISVVLKTNPSDTNKIKKIVTTLFPYYDIAKHIGKDKLEATLLLPPGVEAHSFEPKPSDIIKINEADIFIYTGEILEPWAKDIINGLTDNNIKVVNASDGISLIREENSQQDIDPHIWLDFTNTIKITEEIGNAIISTDPKNADFYQTNINEYIASLEQLDSDYKNGLANCKTRDIIYGGHYAFGYLDKRYNLNLVAAYGVSPDSEPSVQDITGLIDQIKKNNIKYIFYEELLSPRVAQMLADETNTSILLLNPAHNITKDEYENDTTFMSIMKYNLENLKKGLQCQ